jgi:fimbrial chaperone protein
MINSLNLKRSLILIALYLLVGITAISAFSFSPMTVSISPSGAAAVMTYKVTNESDQQTAVSIKVTTRAIAPNGKETNEPADKLFLVFPARVVLKPNSSQNVKVQYRGPATIVSEQAYRVIAEQLPVDFSKSASSGVSILLTYVAALYVTPKNAAPKLVVAKAEGIQKDGIQGLEVTVKNEGTGHALISNSIIKIDNNGSVVTLAGEAMQALDGQNILAVSERVVFVPWAAAILGSTYTGSITAELD